MLPTGNVALADALCSERDNAASMRLGGPLGFVQDDRMAVRSPHGEQACPSQLKDSARRLVTEYARDHVDDLHRVWETERLFELHLDGVIVSGRADVILDEEDGVPTALAILDYKTSTRGESAEHELQLQVYADAGRREGLDVRGAYVHDLGAGRRDAVDVSAEAVDRQHAPGAAASRRGVSDDRRRR